MSEELLRSKIRDVPDFPEPGVVFKDITPLLQDCEALELACDLMARPFIGGGVDLVVAAKGRGGVGWLEAPENPRDLKAWKYHKLADVQSFPVFSLSVAANRRTTPLWIARRSRLITL